MLSKMCTFKMDFSSHPLKTLAMLIVFLTVTTNGHPIRDDHGQSYAPKTPFDVEKYSEYLHNFKCNEIKIRHYHKSLKCDEIETGSIYRLKSGRPPYRSYPPRHDHLPHHDYPLYHDHPPHRDYTPHLDHHDQYETKSERYPLPKSTSEEPYVPPTAKPHPTPNHKRTVPPPTAEPRPVSEALPEGTQAVLDTTDRPQISPRSSPTPEAKKRPTLTLTAGGFIEEVDFRGRNEESGSGAPQTRSRRQADGETSADEGAEQDGGEMAEGESSEKKEADEDEEDEKYVDDDDEDDELEEEPSKPKLQPFPRQGSPPLPRDVPPLPKGESPPLPPPRGKPSPRALRRERRHSYDEDYFDDQDDYQDGPLPYGLYNSHDGPGKSREVKDHHMPECTAPLYYGWRHYNWYQILVENGGPPGGYLKGGLKAELTKVEDPCARPVKPVYTEYKKDFTFKYAKVGKVFRVESVNVRLARTPHEFLDFEGQLIWAPPNVTNRYYQIVYRKDDTGLYVRPVADTTCRFRETVNRHTDSYDIQLACDLHPGKFCYCDKHGLEVCYTVPHEDGDDIHYENFGHYNQEKPYDGREHYDKHELNRHYDERDHSDKPDEREKHDHDGHHDEQTHDHRDHDKHHDEHDHHHDKHDEHDDHHDKHNEHDDHHHDKHDEHDDHPDENDEHDDDHDNKHGEHNNHSRRDVHASLDSGRGEYDHRVKKDGATDDWGCGLYGGRGYCG